VVAYSVRVGWGAGVRLINVASVQCDPQATCAGASCVCGVNYFGTGQTCDRTAHCSVGPHTRGMLTASLCACLRL
jgi:hypothetical protein